MQIYTTTLTSGSITLNRADGASVISIQPALNSACLFSGSFPFQQQSSIPIALSNGQVFNYSSASANSPLDGITITWVSGNVDIVIGF